MSRVLSFRAARYHPFVRTLFATSLALGALVLFACSADYGSDEPAGPESDGGASGEGGGAGKEDGSGGGAEGSVTPGKPITVTGKIIGYGVGMANVPVVVGGKVAVNTSTLGTFTVPDVQPPYDVVFALKTVDAQPRVTVYQGLTRPDPTLVALGTNGELRPNPIAATSLTGTVEGASGPGWARAPFVSFGAPNRAYGVAQAEKETGAFTMQGTDGPLWYGANAVTGSLHASLVLGTAPSVTAFYGRLDNVTVTSNTKIVDQIVKLEPVSVGTFRAKITAPSSFDDATKTVVNMGTRYEETAGYFVRAANPGAFPLDVNLSVPLVSGSSFQANVGYTVGADGEASYARAVTNAAESAQVTLALAEPPVQTEPSDGATDVARGAAFTFGAFPNGVHRFTLVAANQPTVTVVTAATTVTLPDLAPFAVALPSGVEYTWRVAGYRPLASLDVDELAAFLSTIDGNLPYVDQCEIAISPARKVTFAP